MKDIKRRIKEGERVFGSWLQLPDADIAEIYEQIGFDFLSIDMEHSEISIFRCGWDDEGYETNRTLY